MILIARGWRDAVFGCDMNKTDFGRAHLIGCTFTGRLKDVEFRGGQSPPYKIGNQLECKSGGILDSVDFSKAHFDGNDFRNGIDLSKCIFPSEQVTYLPDSFDTLTRVRKIIESKCSGRNKEKILFMIDFDIDRAIKGQKQQIIEWDVYSDFGGECTMKYREALTLILNGKPGQ